MTDPGGQPWGDPTQRPPYGAPGYPQAPGNPPPQGYPPPQGSPPSPAGQPGYAAPGQGGPGYPAPGQGGPGYPAPQGGPGYQPGYQNPGQAGPGYQPFPGYPQGYAPPPAKRSRLPLILAIVAVVVLVIAGGAVAAVLALRNTGTAVGAPSGGPTTTTPSPTKTTSVSLDDPDSIGSLKKGSDQSTADTLRSTMQGAGIEKPFAVVYQDSAKPGRTLVLWGGTGQIFGIGAPQRQLDSFFTSAGAQMKGGTFSNRAPASTGSVGGLAECQKVSGLGATITMCGWIGGNALLGFIFGGYTQEQASALVPTVLSAVVVNS